MIIHAYYISLGKHHGKYFVIVIEAYVQITP